MFSKITPKFCTGLVGLTDTQTRFIPKIISNLDAWLTSLHTAVYCGYKTSACQELGFFELKIF